MLSIYLTILVKRTLSLLLHVIGIIILPTSTISNNNIHSLNNSPQYLLRSTAVGESAAGQITAAIAGFNSLLCVSNML